MSYVIQAVYENGVLRPLEKLDLGEHQQVEITMGPHAPVASAMVVPITTLDPEPLS
jgi:predicted DNA-binding antitoxin AbrB/MazE fold protein